MLFLGYLVGLISLNHLSIAAYRYQIFDYYSLVHHILGKHLALLIGSLMVIHWTILTISYQSLLNLFIPYLSKPFSYTVTMNERAVIMGITNLCIIFPISVIKDIDNTNFTKFINAIVILYLLALNIYRFVIDWPIHNINWYSTDITSTSMFACVLSFYSGYYYLPQLQDNLYEPNPKRTFKVIFRSLSSLFTLFSVITLTTYLDSPYFRTNWSSIGGEMMLAVNLLVLIPNSIVTLRIIILDLIEVESRGRMYSLFSMTLINLAFIVGSCAVSIFFDKIFVIFNLLGVINSVMMVAIPVILNKHWNGIYKAVGIIYAACVITTSIIGLEVSIAKDIYVSKD